MGHMTWSYALDWLKGENKVQIIEYLCFAYSEAVDIGLEVGESSIGLVLSHMWARLHMQ